MPMGKFRRGDQTRDCSLKFPLDVLWLPKSAIMKPVGPDISYSEYILVVGISKPKLAALFLSVMIISLFFTFHVLYDRAVFSMQVTPTISDGSSGYSMGNRRSVFDDAGIVINHPIVVPNRVHFPKTGRRLPQALIIGVRKCGTRALLEMLYLHPRIQKAAGEVHFFDRDENYLKGLEWYRKKMPHSFRGQITIEKSPSYFVTPEVPERVRAMNASVKLLLIVREPVTRAISDYTQLRSHSATATLPQVQGTTSGGVAPSSQVSRNFEELALFPNGSVNESYRPLAISMYHLHMHRWLEVFPREQMLIVNGDQLIDDPLSQLTRIETFLGIQHRIKSNNFYFNATKGFFCLRNETGDKCLRETKGRKHPHVDPAVISKLRRFFADHNQKFYELIGEDLGWPEE
ncbi:heparan sulfate glucosamine 3-O-sulfotransferase 5 [Lutzomyia longipalpis]|uniref:heparan sulfate glucosamine 3-O-sulfotransferase 5 n=1 Tax=Lutzomyia longipalpis TaxID=7200 RepID=UPI0024836A65|nr:heparan sulfate glucosamine 3-O-sulfotransferase 5 [Lutzomyia longipalpis]XP_055688626.1 heparan sulfate glucosamine 3-O-sulfotransferase 5 [Lutzomyia longipalpis]XP_055688627.1 heparan sulfate glucosamine 3-O-sulfotransferase 5 [Lutzomyia longipalpis]XP_055688628.1 heparan sulfate glucosamine 3-O-sulfotransferase 5 [Lutzomyia longipalpis]